MTKEQLLKRVTALEKCLLEQMKYCQDNCRGSGIKRGGNDSGDPCKWPPCMKARKLVGTYDDSGWLL